jgi:hypothetical protein
VSQRDKTDDHTDWVGAAARSAAQQLSTRCDPKDQIGQISSDPPCAARGVVCAPSRSSIGADFSVDRTAKHSRSGRRARRGRPRWDALIPPIWGWIMVVPICCPCSCALCSERLGVQAPGAGRRVSIAGCGADPRHPLRRIPIHPERDAPCMVEAFPPLGLCVSAASARLDPLRPF